MTIAAAPNGYLLQLKQTGENKPIVLSPADRPRCEGLGGSNYDPPVPAGEHVEPSNLPTGDSMIVATAEITSAAVLVHLEDGALLVLRSGMLTQQDISEVAAVLEDATLDKRRVAALCLYDRRDEPTDGLMRPADPHA